MSGRLQDYKEELDGESLLEKFPYPPPWFSYRLGSEGENAFWESWRQNNDEWVGCVVCLFVWGKTFYF